MINHIHQKLSNDRPEYVYKLFMSLCITTMPTIQPWLYPPNSSVDRVTYTPTLSAHILEYQEEMIDAEGNVYWKTVDSTTFGGSTSVKEFLEQMKDFYETKSCRKDKMKS